MLFIYAVELLTEPLSNYIVDTVAPALAEDQIEG